jgi:hypothetical protein
MALFLISVELLWTQLVIYYVYKKTEVLFTGICNCLTRGVRCYFFILIIRF